MKKSSLPKASSPFCYLDYHLLKSLTSHNMDNSWPTSPRLSNQPLHNVTSDGLMQVWSAVSDSVTQWTVTSVHEILQARILEWVAIPFSRGSSQTRDQTPLSHIAGRFCKPFDCLRKPCDCLSSLIHS